MTEILKDGSKYDIYQMRLASKVIGDFGLNLDIAKLRFNFNLNCNSIWVSPNLGFFCQLATGYPPTKQRKLMFGKDFVKVNTTSTPPQDNRKIISRQYRNCFKTTPILLMRCLKTSSQLQLGLISPHSSSKYKFSC